MDNDVVDLMVLFVELVKVVDVLMIPASQLSPAFISDLLQSKPFHDYHDFGEFFNTLIPSIVQNVNFRFSKDSHGMDVILEERKRKSVWISLNGKMSSP